ncbi:MAG: mechanosensitive ion channel [Synergistaceae bacterium]|nr:mechanosensitive ion channel [Synergistaceae bacterium]
MKTTARGSLNIFSCLCLAFLLIMIISGISHAESLSDLKREMVEYQSQPLERIRILKNEILNIQGIEDGLARQYKIPVSQVISYEMMLESNIQIYHSIYFLQNQGSSASQLILEEGRLEEMAQHTSPYSFLLYLNFLEDVQDYHDEAERYKKLIEQSKNTITRNNTERIEAEKAFRLVNDQLSLGGASSLTNSWRMREIKAKLEEYTAVNTLSTTTLSLAEKELSDVQGKIETIAPMLDNIRRNIRFTSDDFAVLNAMVFEKTKSLYDTIAMLREKITPFSTLNNDAADITPFARFWLSNEKQLVRDEILMILEVIEKWTSLRSVWRGIQDLIEGNLDIGRQKLILSRTNNYIDDINTNMSICVDAIQTIRETEQAVSRRFSNKNPIMTESDLQIRDRFLDNLSARKKRYLSYLVDLGMIRSQYKDLQKESMRITGTLSNEDKLNFLWISSLSRIKETELWHVGEYPITIGKFFFALMIFLSGFALTRYFAYAFRKRTADGLSMSRHSSLIVQKFIYYTGVIVSAFFGLWSLRIPLTAFAFLGGAVAIAVGFGAQKYTGDILSGIILLFQKKVRIGDEVIISDQRGIVEEITLQNTVVRCEQSNHLILPNSRVLEGEIINLTLNNSFTRSEVRISVAYDTDIEKAMSIIREILSNDKNVLKSPPYKILLEDFGESALDLTALFFVDIKENLERDVKSSVRQKILAAFSSARIEIPFPQRDIRIKNETPGTEEK